MPTAGAELRRDAFPHSTKTLRILVHPRIPAVLAAEDSCVIQVGRGKLMPLQVGMRLGKSAHEQWTAGRVFAERSLTRSSMCMSAKTQG